MNPSGGAVALGHPLGASGTRLVTAMLHHMQSVAIRYGLRSMCEGSGRPTRPSSNCSERAAAGARRSGVQPMSRPRPRQYGSRRTVLRTLPDALRGSAAKVLTEVGHL